MAVRAEDWEAFEASAQETAFYEGVGTGGRQELAYLGLGLAGEAGEVADCLKKVLRMGSPPHSPEEVAYIQKNKLEALGELGDVLWYWTRLVFALGSTPEEVMATNVKKLAERKAQGKLKMR